ncbi:hypothetical protein ABI59_16805 [Acidobacteria bacterium Mor1]|nr:hypothetical protein ABI59_16805 [Acidobacteria bacterium Mor1]
MISQRVRQCCNYGLLIAVLFAGGAVSAEDSVDRGPTKALSLTDCLRMALANNLDLVSARQDPMISEQNVMNADAAFDMALTADYTRSESEQELSNQFSLDSSTDDTANVGITKQLGFGGSYTVNLRDSRSIQTGPLVVVDTSYRSSLTGQFDMPLMRGFGSETAQEQLKLAEGNLEISKEQLRVQANSTLESVEAAYWDVAAAIRALGVSDRKLTRAEELLELNRKKVEVGTLAPIEITQAEAEVASNQESLIVAEVTLENAEDELLRLLAVPESDNLWAMAIDTVDEPTFDFREIDLPQVIRTALDRRPEMKNAKQTLINNELSERVARQNVRPQLDLSVSYTATGNNFELGAGPDGIPGTPDDMTVTMGALSEALSEIPDNDNFNWSAGVNFRYPLRNRAAKASYAIAQLNREKSAIDVKNQEQTIRVEVRRAVRDVESGKKRVDAARANVVLQRKKLEAEQKKFENGMSTSFEVLTFQNDLADAELAEIRALIDYNKALVALERVKGTLLEARGLTL